MSEKMWITSHLERLLQAEWDQSQLEVDSDGDYPFRNGTAARWVGVVDTSPIMIRGFAHAAIGVSPSLKLFLELNDISPRAVSAKVDLSQGTVVVSQTIKAVGLTRPVLRQAIHALAGIADDTRLLLAATFGGSTHFPTEDRANDNRAA